jgi:hypothetical protein
VAVEPERGGNLQRRLVLRVLLLSAPVRGGVALPATHAAELERRRERLRVHLRERAWSVTAIERTRAVSYKDREETGAQVWRRATSKRSRTVGCSIAECAVPSALSCERDAIGAPV